MKNMQHIYKMEDCWLQSIILVKELIVVTDNKLIKTVCETAPKTTNASLRCIRSTIRDK